MEKQTEYYLLNKIQDDLFSRYFDAMKYLKIPEYEKRNDDTNLPVNPVNRKYLLNEANILGEWNTNNMPMVYHKLHEIRLGLYSIKMMDILGITNEYWRQQIFAGFSTHDNGKYLLMGPNSSFPINANLNFEEREREIIQYHTSVEKGFVTRDMGDDVAYMRENHHKNQTTSEPYPKKSVILYTPERIFATELLSIMDFYDSATTRIDSRTEKDNGKIGEFSTFEKAKRKLEEEYGELELRYEGEKFPNINMKGIDFMELMYKEKIFKNSDPWFITPLKLISKELAHEAQLETRLNPFR